MKNIKVNKFKEITGSMELHLESDYFSNRVWIFNAAWVNSLKHKSNLQLRNKLNKTRLNIVKAKLAGAETRTIGIDNVVSAVKLKEFKTVSVKDCIPIKGFERGDASKYGVVAFKIGNGPAIDYQFFPALQWDSETTIHVNGKLDPIVITKNGAIVGMIAPLQLK